MPTGDSGSVQTHTKIFKNSNYSNQGQFQIVLFGYEVQYIGFQNDDPSQLKDWPRQR
jgi:hypothetical protein